MVGHGDVTTSGTHGKMAYLKVTTVKPLSIEKCMKQMYGEDRISNTENYDQKNAICMQGRIYHLFICNNC